MLRTIRNKFVFGVLALILVIQVISAALQVSQVRSIFMNEFILGAQNLAQGLFIELRDRIKIQISGDEEIPESEIVENIDLFFQIIQTQKFDSFLITKDDLLSLMFVNKEKQLVVQSEKSDQKINHQNLAQNEDLKIQPSLESLVKSAEPASYTDKGLIFIYVPFYLNEDHLGGMVMTYSNNRLQQAQWQIYRNSALIVLVFMIISVALVIPFVKVVLTRPIQNMIQLMDKLANGEFESRFEIKNSDEIGEMGQSVNQLVDSLQVVFQSISDIMGGVEQGDLSQQINMELTGELESIKTRINKSIHNLSNTLCNVKGISESVETSAKELANSAEMLSNSSTRQAAALEQISSSIAEVESHSKQNTSNAQEASRISNSTTEMVKAGNQKMEELQSCMDQINLTSLDVTKIIKVIDEIAFQTNLLALNAAVEAARAGKYGKGFAVVAEEVRNLAARSAEASKETSSLIESSMKEVESGVEKASQTSSILKDIVMETQKTNGLVSEIAGASQDQNNSIAEIFNSISDVNESVQQNSAVSQQTAASSDVLFNQSTNLQQEIQQFSLASNRMTEGVRPELIHVETAQGGYDISSE